MQILETFKNVFKVKDLKDRILVTLGLLIIFRVGAHIVSPGVDMSKVEAWKQELGHLGWFGGFISILTAGSFFNLAIFSLGIMPYITSSIIMSLMTKVSPKLEQLAKEGPSGQRKISQYTRLLTLPVCLIQSLFTLKMVQDYLLYTGFGANLMIICSLTCGAMFVMWLGEQISEFGIGNGASILIMAGILDRMPSIIGQILESARTDPTTYQKGLVILLLYIGIVIAIIFITQSQRRIPIQHAKHFRGGRVWMGSRNYLPLKLNTAGVMPVIFAQSLIALPYMLAQIPGLDWIENQFRPGHIIYAIFYTGCIFFFAYFWTYLFFQPQEMANNLKEYGSFIPGIRPGENTAQYVDFIISRLTICGAAFLCFIALVPDVFSAFLDMDRFLLAFLGGTGILIVVGVCLDVIQKMESYLLLHHYSGFVGTSPIRGRR